MDPAQTADGRRGVGPHPVVLLLVQGAEDHGLEDTVPAHVALARVDRERLQRTRDNFPVIRHRRFVCEMPN